MGKELLREKEWRAFMDEKYLEEDVKRLRADREKLLDTLQTLLNDTQTFLEPGSKMEDASEAITRLWKIIRESQAILNEMKSK